MAHSFVASPRASVQTGLDHVLEALSARARSPLGQARARALPVLDSPALMAAHMAAIDEARALAQDRDAVPTGHFPDVGPLLGRLARDGVLEGTELCQIAEVMAASEALRQFGVRVAHRAQSLNHWLGALADLRPLERLVRAAVGPDGHVLDDASLGLKQARQKVQGLMRRIREHMEGYLQNDSTRELLMDQFISVRHGRYVLPVRAQMASRIPGIVHNASQTGQTLFIEPEGVTSLGNALAVARAEEEVEVRRVLEMLSEELADGHDALAQALEVLTHIDVLGAAAELSAWLNWHTPHLVASTERLVLPQLRHPQLSLSGCTPVPNTVQLGEDARVMLVSGPNAGGKTALLTAVGLAVLMSRRGLPLATSEPATLPVYRGLFCAVGDDQDMALGLSSFAAQLSGLKALSESVAPGWLILVDELGGDTDPEEGAALARAVLDHAIDAGAQGVVTTHLSGLKMVPLQDARYVNARMGYDAETLMPTFRLERGVAGQSKAFDAARRLGFSPALLARAEAVMGDRGGVVTALAGLEKAQNALITERHQLAQERAQAEVARAHAQRVAENVARALSEEFAAKRRALAQELAATRREVDGLLTELKRDASVERAQRTRAALVAKQAELPPLTAAPPPPGRPLSAHTALREGMWVRVQALGKTGQVVAFTPTHVTVAMGALRTRVRRETLELVDGPTPSAAAQKRPVRAPAPARAASVPAPTQCDVRGLRLDEAERVVMRALDACLSQGQHSLWVIHGHGSGALKEGLRDMLQISPYVAGIAAGGPEQGGEGVTVVALDR